MDKAVIILPNEKIKTYQTFVIFLHLINIALLMLFQLTTDKNSFIHDWTNGMIGVGLGNFCIWIFTKKSRDFYIRSMVATTLISSSAWFLMGENIAGLALILLSIMALKVLKKLSVIFDKNGIIYPSFPKKYFKWNQAENVQLKDNVLSIDLKNNQLFQFTLNEKENPDLDENAFNGFVKECMSITG